MGINKEKGRLVYTGRLVGLGKGNIRRVEAKQTKQRGQSKCWVGAKTRGICDGIEEFTMTTR